MSWITSGSYEPGAVAFIVALLDDQAAAGLGREFGAERGITGRLEPERVKVAGKRSCCAHDPPCGQEQGSEVQENDERSVPYL